MLSKMERDKTHKSSMFRRLKGTKHPNLVVFAKIKIEEKVVKLTAYTRVGIRV